MAECVRAAPQTLFVLQKWKPYIHQLSEKSADFCLAFAFSYCCGKFTKLQTASMLIGMKSQFAGVSALLNFAMQGRRQKKLFIN